MNERMRRIAKRIAAGMNDGCREALADYLGWDIADISEASDWSGHAFEVNRNGQEYYVFDDEEAATEAAVESVKNTLSEIGIECVNGWEYYIDTDYFDYDRHQYWHEYAYDISHESDPEYGNRLVREAYEKGIIDDSDFDKDDDGDPDYACCNVSDDELMEQYGDRLYEDEEPVEWIKACFPDGVLKGLPGCVRLDDFARHIVNVDGRGSELSVYDGKERVHLYNGKEYYIYRTN